jgi:hypothetical protein
VTNSNPLVRQVLQRTWQQLLLLLLLAFSLQASLSAALSKEAIGFSDEMEISNGRTSLLEVEEVEIIFSLALWVAY